MNLKDSEKNLLQRIFLKHNLVSMEDYEEILEIYDDNRANFVNRIISGGYVKTPRFFPILAKELSLEYCNYQRLFENKDKVKLYPYRFLKRYLVFPLEQSPTTLTFATANPFDNEFLNYIKKSFKDKYRIKLAIANPFEIASVLDNEYRGIHSLEAVGELAYRFPDESASRVLTQPQRIFLLSLASIFVIWFIFDYTSAFLVLFVLINLIYFIANPVKLYIALQGFGRGKVINVTKKEIKSIKDEELPLYTIFVPLFKEAESLAQILSNIAKLDYPRDKLDVKIILEQEDGETIQAAKELGLVAGEGKEIKKESKAANLPGKSFEAIIVPRADIKTKPRACNFALKRALGEFCVIYDAEDNPDPDQLKKVICAFRQLEEKYICVQAKLNYYNPTQNILTKWFTLEYYFWFDYYLPGLVGINAPLPLGGTSNHFRTEPLREIGGWDPYNVTEDADLGMRI